MKFIILGKIMCGAAFATTGSIELTSNTLVASGPSIPGAGTGMSLPIVSPVATKPDSKPTARRASLTVEHGSDIGDAASETGRLDAHVPMGNFASLMRHVPSITPSKQSEVTFPPHGCVIAYKRGVLCFSQVLQPINSIINGVAYVTAGVGLSINSFGIVEDSVAPIFTKMVLYGGAAHFLFKNLSAAFEKKVNTEEAWLLKERTLREYRTAHPEALLEEDLLDTSTPSHYTHPQVLPGHHIRGFYRFLLSAAQIVETTGDLIAPVLRYMALTAYVSAGTETQTIQFTIDPRENAYAKQAIILLATSLVADQLSKRSTGIINRWEKYLLECEKLEARLAHNAHAETIALGDAVIVMPTTPATAAGGAGRPSLPTLPIATAHTTPPPPKTEAEPTRGFWSWLCCRRR